jgi:methylenetetrahydrofolate reductase (NADPH)
VSKVFVAYLSGSIKKFPFSEGSLAAETSTISEPLLKMNQNKLLTINSQPKVNGAKSTDPTYGWGPEKGYVYQKSYIEFFIHKNLIQNLIDHLSANEDLTF